jgi:hypothetical protein
MATESGYWFRAKRYGWGWGLPAKWQGWLILAVYVALIIFGARVWPTFADRTGFPIWMIRESPCSA